MNYWQGVSPGGRVSIVGISGGGYIAQVAAAIDPRIELSFPVSGSAPLYEKNVSPGAVGDLEQYYLPLFDEDIAPDWSGGGVATYLELYALGGYGAGRKQIQIGTGEGAPFRCCYWDTYKEIVSALGADLGGEWEHAFDDQTLHRISDGAIATIIMPEVLALPEPGVSGLVAGLLALFAMRTWRRASRSAPKYKRM